MSGGMSELTEEVKQMTLTIDNNAVVRWEVGMLDELDNVHITEVTARDETLAVIEAHEQLLGSGKPTANDWDLEFVRPIS